jgi:hypothetical protein
MREAVPLLNGDAFWRPGADKFVVVLLASISLCSQYYHAEGQPPTSLLLTGTESWTMFPIVPTPAESSFSFASAAASNSLFSFSSAIFFASSSLASSFAYSFVGDNQFLPARNTRQ